MLKKKSSVESDKCKRIFAYFIQKFYKSLTEDKDKDLKETVIAIKGYGAFAGVIFFKIKQNIFLNDKLINLFFSSCKKAVQRVHGGQRRLPDVQYNY